MGRYHKGVEFASSGRHVGGMGPIDHRVYRGPVVAG